MLPRDRSGGDDPLQVADYWDAHLRASSKSMRKSRQVAIAGLLWWAILRRDRRQEGSDPVEGDQGYPQVDLSGPEPREEILTLAVVAGELAQRVPDANLA